MAAAVARWFCGRTSTSRFFFGGVLFLLILLTRWAWIDCDGGTPSLMEYGYFATDEGFYTGGGRQKLLYGQFVNVARSAPCTYAICPSSHVLTWIAFSVFGQTTWAHRVFPLLMSTCAWLGVFFFLSRRTLPWIAFLLLACTLLNPFLTVYGRTACNDTMMASALLIGYIVTRKKGLLFPFLGGCVFGLGIWIKQSIWVLFLIGLSGAAMSFSTKNRLRRTALFLLGFCVSACIQYGLIRLMIYNDAISQNVTVSALLKCSNSSYPLPNPFDWQSTFKGLSSFPRCPADGLLGLWIPLFLVLPALLFIRRLTDKPIRWDGRLLLYLTLPVYALSISILPVFYAHYYIPIIMFVPLIWYEARHDLKLWTEHNRGLGFVLMTCAILYVTISFTSFTVKTEDAEKLNSILSNAYNLPQMIIWCRNGLYLLAAAGVLLLLGLWARRHKLTPWTIIGLSFSSLGVADLCYAQLPLSEAYKFTPIFSASMKDVARLLQVASLALFFIVWALPKTTRHSVRWYLLFVLLFVYGTLANPVWRNGACELTRRGHLHKKAVQELAKLVPENAVVFGERAPQLFLSLKPRVAPCPNGDPVPAVLKMHTRYPNRPLYAVLDAEHNYHYSHYEKNKDKLQLQVIHTLKLPSFNTSLPSDVFLIRLWVIDKNIKGPLP
jgi:4-amino-4-deoxy-L-arabinose transferase-like glycosyltransferase